MKKLLLIQASGGLRRGLSYTQSKYPSLALGIVAGLSPEGWDVQILDSLNASYTGYSADLVAITAYTPTVNVAYQIAFHYRERKIPVIIGGIHATLVPDEAMLYCDSVVTGEAESIWPEVISDFEKGELKKIYKATILRCLIIFQIWISEIHF